MKRLSNGVTVPGPILRELQEDLRKALDELYEAYKCDYMVIDDDGLNILGKYNYLVKDTDGTWYDPR